MLVCYMVCASGKNPNFLIAFQRHLIRLDWSPYEVATPLRKCYKPVKSPDQKVGCEHQTSVPVLKFLRENTGAAIWEPNDDEGWENSQNFGWRRSFSETECILGSHDRTSNG
jgi:hypothetical protein